MGGKHRPGTPKDRALGAELRAIREAKGMSLQQVAKVIQWNVSTLSRLERGLRHISTEAVMGLSIVYELPLKRREELVDWVSRPVTLGWWDRTMPGVPSDLGALASYEHEAIRMTHWAPAIIPGLLQTMEYAAVVMRTTGVAEEAVNPRLGARLKRQELLNRRGLDYLALIGAAALRNRLGGPETFALQLRHVVRMSKREGLTVRVVDEPTAYSLTSWYLMNFENTGPVVMLDHLDSATFLFDEETLPYSNARKVLRDMALSERATQDKIEEAIEQVLIGS